MISLNFFDDRGILGSVQSALKQCSQASGIFVLPVDQPFVSYKLLLAMQQSAQIKYNNPSIILVNYYIESGHPVYFSRHFFSELNSCHENFGMRGLIVRHKKYVHQLFWPDARILSNINTAKDLGHIIKTSGEAKTLCCTSDIKLHSL